MLSTDNKRFDPPQGWYLINLVTLVFTKFEKFKHPSIRWCPFRNILEPPYLNLKHFNFTP